MRTLSSRIRIRCTSCNFSRKPCRQLDQVCRSRWRLQVLRNQSQFWKPIWPNLSKWIPQTRGLAQVPTELTFEAYCMSMRINPSPKRDVNNKHFLYDWGYITQSFGHVVSHELSQMVLDRCLTLIPNLNSVFFYMLWFLRSLKIAIPTKMNRCIPILLYVINLTLVSKSRVVQRTSWQSQPLN